MSSLSRTLGFLTAIALPSAAFAQNPPAAQPPAPMTFFVTSVGKGDGANYGGLEGADRYCKSMADAVGAAPAGRTWRAYLSQPAANGQPAVNARDRIGAGPWHNQKGALMAANVAALHGDSIRDRNQMNKTNSLTEKGTPVNGVGDTPNQHDIITGSDSFGRAVGGANDLACNNYTSNAATGSVFLGHSDRTGGGNSSWNSAHASRGCGQTNLVATGGAGLLYCFAAN
ncbi:MAG: lectin [Gemmatimonadaceae bacterium]